MDSPARFETFKNYYLALQSADCYNQPMLYGLTTKRSLPTAIVWVAALAFAFGGLLRLSSPIQLVETASSQPACGDTQCCDEESLIATEYSPIGEEIFLLCCEHQGDCVCACCNPIASASLSVIELRRLRDFNQPIDQSMARVDCSPLLKRYLQLPCPPTGAAIPKHESLLKLKSLLIV